jgi:hypothetical protein
MHIQDFNEEVTSKTQEDIIDGFMMRFWSDTATYTGQARTSALPPKMVTFIKDALKSKGEWLDY